MMNALVEKVATRIGTGLGAALSAYGVSTGDMTILLAAIPVLLGLMIDIGTRSIFKKAKKR